MGHRNRNSEIFTQRISIKFLLTGCWQYKLLEEKNTDSPQDRQIF